MPLFHHSDLDDGVVGLIHDIQNIMIDLHQQLQDYAQRHQMDIEDAKRLYVLEQLARCISRILISQEQPAFIFRGSLILQNWVYPKKRVVKDLDFLGMDGFDMAACKQLITQALGSNEHCSAVEFYPSKMALIKTWVETDFPGTRIIIPYRFLGDEDTIQMDFGFDDTVYPKPIIHEYQTMLDDVSFPIPTVSPEIALAWKVHGLFEFWDKGYRWSSKTLYDIHLILTELTIDKELFGKVIGIAFEDKNTPMWTYRRVFNGQFGLSKSSRRTWKVFLRKNGLDDFPWTHLEILEIHREFLDEFFIEYA